MGGSAAVAALNSVLVGTLLVGSSLPFDRGAAASLWDGPSVSGAAVARLALIALVLVLVGVALAGATMASGILQFAVSVVNVAALVKLAADTEPSSGAGGTLLTVSALVAAVVGAAVAAIAASRGDRRSRKT